MTATNQHIRNSGRGNTHQTSHQSRIIKAVANVVGVIIGLIVAVVMWVVVRPILRGVGWLISIQTIEQCCQFIIGEVKKSGCCGFTDDEIFGWAMHFWDEPEIEVSETANCRVVVNHVVELTAEEKEKARQDAINKLRDEEMAKMRRPKTTETKTQDVQPSLFDF